MLQLKKYCHELLFKVSLRRWAKDCFSLFLYDLKGRILRKMVVVACASRRVARKLCHYTGCDFKKYPGTVV